MHSQVVTQSFIVLPRCPAVPRKFWVLTPSKCLERSAVKGRSLVTSGQPGKSSSTSLTVCVNYWRNRNTTAVIPSAFWRVGRARDASQQAQGKRLSVPILYDANVSTRSRSLISLKVHSDQSTALPKGISILNTWPDISVRHGWEKPRLPSSMEITVQYIQRLGKKKSYSE